MAPPTLDMVVANMLSILTNLLPPPPPPPPLPAQPLPDPSVSLVSVAEKSVGVGNRLGIDVQGPLSISVLKGVRLDAVVRFQFWGDDPVAVDASITNMHGLLLAAKEQLKKQGFLNLEAVDTLLAQHSLPDAWRKTATYRMLFEFIYQDTDDSGGLIARIPININSSFNETTVVTDEMVRWDADAAPALEVRGSASRGSFSVGELAILAFLPVGFNGDGVTVTAFDEGVQRQRFFASVRDFRDAFTLAPDPIELGGQLYLAGRMAFPNADFPDPIVLSRVEDFFQIAYASPPLNDINAGVYLRVLR